MKIWARNQRKKFRDSRKIQTKTKRFEIRQGGIKVIINLKQNLFRKKMVSLTPLRICDWPILYYIGVIHSCQFWIKQLGNLTVLVTVIITIRKWSSQVSIDIIVTQSFCWKWTLNRLILIRIKWTKQILMIQVSNETFFNK